MLQVQEYGPFAAPTQDSGQGVQDEEGKPGQPGSVCVLINTLHLFFTHWEVAWRGDSLFVSERTNVKELRGLAGWHVGIATHVDGSYSHTGHPVPGNHCRCVRGPGQTAERPGK